MFNMRLKLGSAGKNEWRACFCLHVKTATIVFGVYHLLLHVLALTVVSLVMRNQSYINQKNEFIKNDYLEGDFLPTPLSKVKDDDNPYYLPTTQDGRTVLPSDVDMGAIITICTLSITLLMVYGAIKGKPKHILPFFFLQLFDFAITTLTATGYFCYLRSVHRLVAEHWHNMPFHQELLSLSPQTLSLLVLLSFLVSMIWKAYWIGVVWRCYKYLTLKKQATHNTIHYILPNDGLDRSEPDYAAMFRDNEAALFGPMKQTAPPSYQDVMDDQPPPYPAATAEESPITTTTTCVVQEVPIRRFLVTYSPDNPQEVHPEDGASSSEETITPRNLVSPVASASNVASPKKELDNKQEEHVLQVNEDPEYCYLDVEALKRNANEEKPEK
ncbi:lysosomal-associated transmembrane protein 4B [Euwallacea similis]|uniref:lysosomal-associated transmembrane protein 4B n=1 Tax=Euwallacea similis TaxID=1736056 RepID=UPI00344F997F